MRRLGPYGADVVIECVGRPGAVPEGWEFCSRWRQMLVLGQYADAGTVEINPHLITRKQLQISGSWGFEPRHVDRALTMLENPHWQERFGSEVTHRFPLDQASEAINTARKQDAGKTVITP